MEIDGTFIDFFFDGLKCFLMIEEPTDKELKEIPRVEFTADVPYEPSKRLFTRRLPSIAAPTIEEWRENLGCPPRHIVQKTLEHTTQYIKTIEAETREIMRDHLQARAYPLRPHRINDKAFTDTFFSSVKSIRGYSMFQIFCLCNSLLDVTYLMRKKSQAADAYADFVRDVGAPTALVHDMSKEQQSERFKKTSQRAFIEEHDTAPYHQNSNLAERRGGDLKSAVEKLMQIKEADPMFW